MEPSRRFDHRLAGGDRAFFYVLSGTVLIGGRSVTAGQIAWSEPTAHNDESSVTLETSASDHLSVVMIYSGRPIGEPVAMGGPFVMNTQAEIEQAFQDFHQGKFGRIPRQARLD